MLHDDEIRVDGDLARRLVARQFPHWRHLPVTEVVAAATDNAVFRIGSQLAARFPRRPGDVGDLRDQLIARAQLARELSALSPVPTPQPVALGDPDLGYPLPWTVQTWVPGRTAIDDDPADSAAFASDLAAFIAALRGADTAGRRFTGGGRGGEIATHDDWVRGCLRRSAGLLDVDALGEKWSRYRTLPRPAADAMVHGDLMPGNVLVADGRLAGVVDADLFGPADPALDLVGAWHLLDSGPRDVLRRALRCDDEEWERGRAWAFAQAIGLVWYYADSLPAVSLLGRTTLGRLNEG